MLIRSSASQRAQSSLSLHAGPPVGAALGAGSAAFSRLPGVRDDRGAPTTSSWALRGKSISGSPIQKVENPETSSEMENYEMLVLRRLTSPRMWCVFFVQHPKMLVFGSLTIPTGPWVLVLKLWSSPKCLHLARQPSQNVQPFQMLLLR